MVRTYKRKTDRPEISEISVASAVKDVLKKKLSIREAALKYNLKKSMLHKRVVKGKSTFLNPAYDSDSGNSNDGELNSLHPRVADRGKYMSQQIFSNEQEIQLVKYLLEASLIHYGLTYSLTRELAFEFAVSLKIAYPDSWNKNKSAGLDWMKSFMRRHRELSLRKPENTSLARAIGFNQVNIAAFFRNYAKVMDRFKFLPNRIFNIDETGITTAVQAPKIIAPTGKKQVGQIVSGERGELVSFCGIISAAGTTIPPVMIFPRIKLKDCFLNGTPIGSLGLSSRNGWMTSELFVIVLEHLVKYSNCSVMNRILVIMDNHVSHISIEAITFAKAHGIVLLTFPPHCSHRLQPLDVGVYGPFKSAIKIAFNDWMRSNPGKAITIYNVAELANKAFNKSFTSENITNSFKKSGIWPVNSMIFNDEDFGASFVTDQPEAVPQVDDPIIESISNNRDKHLPPHALSATTVMSPEILRPFRKASPRKSQNHRKRGKSSILTETPLKINEETSKIKIASPKNVNLKNKIKKRILYSSSDSVSDVPNEVVLESEEEPGIDEIDDDSSEPPLLIDQDVLKKNDMVLVKFTRRNQNEFYIGKIITVHDSQDFDITFLKRKNNRFTYPDIPDTSQIHRNEIVAQLPQPQELPGTSRSASYIMFNTNFSKYNMG